MRRTVLAVVVAISLLAAPLAFAKRPRSTGSKPTRLELVVLDAINDARRSHRLRALKLRADLQAGARRYARSLLQRNLFAHAGLSGVGEVLAWGTFNLMEPRHLVRLWLDSPPHRRVLLWPDARYLGIGLAVGTFQGHTGVRLAVGRFAAAG
jgi:uncharacterized protein YkwD